jgi:hypothetical protein
LNAQATSAASNISLNAQVITAASNDSLAATRLEKNEVIYRTKKFQKEKLG